MKRTVYLFLLLLFFVRMAPQEPPVSARADAALANAELVAHWKLDEGSGTVAHDSSGNGYDGLITQGTWSSDVPEGVDFTSSLRLDGNGYVDTAAFDLGDSFTITVWAKPDEIENQAIIAKHTSSGANQFIFGTYFGSYHANIGDEMATAGHPLPSWNLLALVAEQVGTRTKLTFYKNGVSQSTRTVSALLGDVSVGRAWAIGQDWDGDTRTDFFKGNLADLRVYDGALTADELARLALEFAKVCVAPTAGRTILQAVSDWSCDIVQVAAGEFPAPMMQPQTGLILRGAGREMTKLSGSGQDAPLLWLDNNMTIEGMTLQGYEAYDSYLGAVFLIQGDAVVEGKELAVLDNYGTAIKSSGTMLLEDVLFQDNTAYTTPAVIDSSGTLQVRNSSFLNSSSYSNGAVKIGGGTAVFEGTNFDSNTFTSGGALTVINSQVTIDDSLFRDNETAGWGAGIMASNSQVAIRDSQFLANDSDTGGAIYSTNNSRLTVERSTFSGNNAFRNGGAIANLDGGKTGVSSSTFSGNSAGYSQAGSIASVFYQKDAEGVFANSTISGNTTDPSTNGLGTTLMSFGAGSKLSLNHVTLAGNDGGRPYDVHGIWVQNGSLAITNSILANNGETNCRLEAAQVSIDGTIADDSSCDSALVSSDLNLGALADNGGPTLTRAIGANSAANDAGDPDFCQLFDQRGVLRNPEACDVGAFEFVGRWELYLPVVVR